MNHRERMKFVRGLIKNVQADIESRLVDMPDNWDGHELRRYIADKFEAADMGLCCKKPRPYREADKKRRSNYENEVIVRNL